MSAPHSASEQKVDITVGPRGSLELLSQREIDTLTDTAGQTRLYELFRQCALAVLNTGSESDDAHAVLRISGSGIVTPRDAGGNHAVHWL